MNEFMSAPLIETYHEGAVCPPYALLYSSVSVAVSFAIFDLFDLTLKNIVTLTSRL